MFWGLIMEPNKRYTQTVEKPFHISQAALDSTTGENTEPCQVMVVVDGKNFLVCTLQKSKCLQVPLDLYFKAGDAVSFLTNGKSNIHLTGYLDPEFEDELEEEESDDEAPALVEPSKKRKLENAADQKSKKAKVDKKQVKADPEDDDDEESDEEDDDDDLEKMLAGSDDEEASDEEEEEEDDEEEDDDQNGVEDSSDEAETTQDTTQDTSKEDLDLSKIDMSKLTKNQKKRLKKKLAQQKPQVNGVDKTKKQEKSDKPEKKADAPADKKEKKSLSGGVQIEDFKVGTGPVAKAGKIVHVYYEGRLKQNNKMFDSCNKGNGFKFRLGSKEVIAGWDVGVAGMKVGGKRKIICPPAMAYGVKGSPPTIPPNSTLVFEVELKNVK